MDKKAEKWLEIFQAKQLDELDCRQLAIIYDDCHEESTYGSATTVYLESNDAERSEFAGVLLASLKNGTDITFVHVQAEGIRNEQNEDNFLWCSRHSCWYQ